MNMIERITQLIAREYSPGHAMVVYMALVEYKPNAKDYGVYGSKACKLLKEMQDQMEIEPDDEDN